MPAKLRFPQLVIRWLFLLLLLLSPALRASAENVKNLKPQGYVNDFAGVLSSDAKTKLTAICTEVDQKTNAQIAIVTVSSLEGEPIEQYSIDLATQWGIGPKQKDRGVLILIATNDRKYRIEVGYGLEGILPDGKVGGFGREAVPFFRQNDYSSAVLLITERIAAVIAEDRNVTLTTLSGVPAPAPESGHYPTSLAIPVWIILLAFFIGFPLIGFLISLLLGGSPRSWRDGRGTGGPWYGGGYGGSGGSSWGSGGGGGGFGGFGGGSFGGGGASGSW